MSKEHLPSKCNGLLCFPTSAFSSNIPFAPNNCIYPSPSLPTQPSPSDFLFLCSRFESRMSDLHAIRRVRPCVGGSSSTGLIGAGTSEHLQGWQSRLNRRIHSDGYGNSGRFHRKKHPVLIGDQVVGRWPTRPSCSIPV